jgi:hypothetical protein
MFFYIVDQLRYDSPYVLDMLIVVDKDMFFGAASSNVSVAEYLCDTPDIIQSIVVEYYFFILGDEQLIKIPEDLKKC